MRDIADPSFCRRMKPAYMGPDSPVKEEFKEFCASNAMDSEPSNFFHAISVSLVTAVQDKTHNVRAFFCSDVTATCYTPVPSWADELAGCLLQASIQANLHVSSSALSACQGPAC